MKKLIFILITIAIALGYSIPANAQYVIVNGNRQMVVKNPGGEGVVVKNSCGEGVVEVYSGTQQQENTTIRVAGMEIVLRGDAPAQPRPRAPRQSSTWFSGTKYQAFIEVGINTLPDVDYVSELYGPGESDFMLLNNIKSLQWAFSIADVTTWLNRRRSFAISMGLQFVSDDYTFSNQVTLTKIDGAVYPQRISERYKKSKLNVVSLKVPLMLHIGTGRGLHVSGGVYGGVVLGSHTKYKKPVTKVRNPYINTVYTGLTARVGVDSWYAYCNYGLRPLFQEGRGPYTCPLTLGIGLGF